MSASLLAVSLLVLAGAGDDATKKDEKKTCLTRRQINAISPLESRYALARLSSGRFYLLTLDDACRKLSPAFTRNLVLDRAASRVCDDGTSLVSFEESGVGPTRCRIEKIDKVAGKEAARELIDAREGGEER